MEEWIRMDSFQTQRTRTHYYFAIVPNNATEMIRLTCSEGHHNYINCWELQLASKHKWWAKALSQFPEVLGLVYCKPWSYEMWFSIQCIEVPETITTLNELVRCGVLSKWNISELRIKRKTLALQSNFTFWLLIDHLAKVRYVVRSVA